MNGPNLISKAADELSDIAGLRAIKCIEYCKYLLLCEDGTISPCPISAEVVLRHDVLVSMLFMTITTSR